MQEHSLGEIRVTLNPGMVSAVERTMMPTILFPYSVSARADVANAADLIVTHAVLELKLVDESNHEIVIGNARSVRLHHRFRTSGETEFNFALTIDHTVLDHIEKLRKGGVLTLLPIIRLVTHPANDPAAIKEQYIIAENWKIPKSVWTEEILPKVGYKNVALVEIPVLEYPALKDTIEKMNLAWKKYSAGDYDDVLVKCRTVLEDLSTFVKKQGFETEKNDENGKQVVPDWKRFLDNDRRGDILGTISQKVNGFVARGAHTGSVISSGEAYFSLLETFAILHYVISNLRRRESGF